MFQRYKNAKGPLFCFSNFLLLAVGLVACRSGGTSAESLPAAFQLYLLPESEATSLAHRATPSKYQAWLDGANLGKALLVLKRSDLASVTVNPNGNLSLALAMGASREIVAILEPKLDVDTILNGEYSLGCLEPEKAFLITVQGKRVVGGTLRCPTELVYTHPEMLTTSRAGAVVLTIQQMDSSLRDTLVTVLQ